MKGMSMGGGGIKIKSFKLKMSSGKVKQFKSIGGFSQKSFGGKSSGGGMSGMAM